MKKKRLVLLLVTAAIMGSSFLNTFAASDMSKDKQTIQKQELKKRLELTAEKYGGKYEIEDEADPNTTLKFNSVEEFEKFLDSSNLQKNIPVPQNPISESTTINTPVADSSLASPLAATSYVQRICTYDNITFGLPVNLIVYLRQKIVANTSYNSTFQKNCFMNVVSATSYLYGTYYSDFSWTCDSQTYGIIDSGRTLWGHINGHLTCKVSISGIGIGATFDQDFYNEWYAE